MCLILMYGVSAGLSVALSISCFALPNEKAVLSRVCKSLSLSVGGRFRICKPLLADLTMNGTHKGHTELQWCISGPVSQEFSSFGKISQ
jgi:hypothetical protein